MFGVDAATMMRLFRRLLAGIYGFRAGYCFEEEVADKVSLHLFRSWIAARVLSESRAVNLLELACGYQKARRACGRCADF